MSLFVFNSLNLSSTRIPRQWPPQATHVRTVFGQEALWCPASCGGSHLSEEELESYRQVGDPIVDGLLERLAEQGAPLMAGGDLLQQIERIESGENDLPHQLSPPLENDLKSFLARYRTVPDWVNVQQLQRGRDVFLTYAPAMGTSLYYRSLVPGFSIPQLAAVVQSTGYLAPPASQEQVSNRLMDTGAMISACMAGGSSIDSLLEGGDGWKAVLHVRILHAKVRRRLLLRKGSKHWDTASLGVPINQEDMAATLLAFSINTLYGVEFIAGMQLSRQEQLDYIALWRYIGWLMGVYTISDEDLMKDSGAIPLDPCGPGWNTNVGEGDPIVHSRSILESIIAHLMKPNESSVAVAAHLLAIGRTRSENSKNDDDCKSERKRLAWFFFRCLQCRRFIGNPLADALQLPQYPVWWKRWLLFAPSTLHLSLLRLYTLATMFIAPIRRRVCNYHAHITARFYDNWKDSHPTRMAKALREAKGGETVHPQQDSVCPFAMVAPPQY